MKSTWLDSQLHEGQCRFYGTVGDFRGGVRYLLFNTGTRTGLLKSLHRVCHCKNSTQERPMGC